MIVGGRVEFLWVNFMSEQNVHNTNTTRSDLEQESSWSRFRTMKSVISKELM